MRHTRGMKKFMLVMLLLWVFVPCVVTCGAGAVDAVDSPFYAPLTVRVGNNILYEADRCVFFTADGRYCIVFTTDTLIYGFQEGIMQLADVFPGQVYIFWVESITAACPSMVYPEMAVRVE